MTSVSTARKRNDFKTIVHLDRVDSDPETDQGCFTTSPRWTDRQSIRTIWSIACESTDVRSQVADRSSQLLQDALCFHVA